MIDDFPQLPVPGDRFAPPAGGASLLHTLARDQGIPCPALGVPGQGYQQDLRLRLAWLGHGLGPFVVPVEGERFDGVVG